MYQSHDTMNGKHSLQPRSVAPTVCINDVLPKDLLLQIFSYLDIRSLCRCSQVCKYWYRLAFDGNNWKSIDLFSFQLDVTPHVVQKIAKNCQGFLRHLRLRGCQDITDDTVRCFTEHCSLIEELVLSECRQLTDVSCEYIGRRCHHLTGLLMDSCEEITDKGLYNLVALSPPPNPSPSSHPQSVLMVLDVSWCRISDTGLTIIATHCLLLQRLRCLGCHHVTSVGIKAIAEHCPHLCLLNVNYCRQGITDEALKSLSTGCPQLRHLSLRECKRITDTGLKHLARGCPDLHTLEVAHCDQITDAGLTALTRSCSMLKKLDVEDCALLTDQSVMTLAMQCPNLDSLILSHCEHMTDEAVRRLASSIAGRESLRHLALDNCPQITDEALDALGMHCAHLSKLDIFDCPQISRRGVSRLNERLKELHMQAYFAPSTPAAVPREHIRPRRCCRRCFSCNLL